MGVSIWWDEADSGLIHVNLTKPWGWDEYLKRIDETIAIIMTRDQLVDAIVEVHSAGALTSGSMMGQLTKILKILPDNMGTIVVITHNDFLRMMNALLIRVSSRARALVVLADSVEEAHRIIASRRQRRGGVFE